MCADILVAQQFTRTSSDIAFALLSTTPGTVTANTALIQPSISHSSDITLSLQIIPPSNDTVVVPQITYPSSGSCCYSVYQLRHCTHSAKHVSQHGHFVRTVGHIPNSDIPFKFTKQSSFPITATALAPPITAPKLRPILHLHHLSCRPAQT